MNKRTIDADKLHEAVQMALAHTSLAAGAPALSAKRPSRQDVHDAFDAAFPLVSPPTHNLVPLPESEWPEWHNDWCCSSAKKQIFRIGNVFLVHCAEQGDDNPWAATNEDDTTWDDKDWEMWQPTPAAALEAAGLPVELLGGLKRPESKPESRPESPAHENPRVVAAAVEMVKEVEQHKAKAARDREEWLAQFPDAWRRRDCLPLRRVGNRTVYYDMPGGYGVTTNDGLFTPANFDSLAKAVDRESLGLHLYADGNVPLWGDVFVHKSNRDKELHLRSFVTGSDRISSDAHWDKPTDCYLLRRHPAIADLPGIRNGSSADKPDSNDSGGGVIVPPKPEYDPNDVAFKPKVKLRVGQRVEQCASTSMQKTGRIVGFVGGDSSRVRVWIDGWNDRVFHASDLTPIPPPLIDNGDGTWTMEGYGMFRIKEHPDGGKSRWEFLQSHAANGLWSHGEWIDERNHVYAAAEDLWRRMEGVG